MIFDYYTSDPHMWHANVIKYCSRPFADVQEMNEVLIKNWNDTVPVDATILCLGDFSMAGGRPIETISRRLNGTKYLVPGNHDFVHSYNRKSRKEENRIKWIQHYTQHGWTILPEKFYMDIPGVATVNLCHIPYDNLDPRYQTFKMKDDGRWLLCGHVHQAWKFNGKMINCGVDVWDMKPVHIDTLKQIILDNPDGFPKLQAGIGGD